MKFRKKPVVIEAFQWEPEARVGSAPNWFYEGCAKRALCPEFNGTLTVYTLEGAMRADPGDWIIKGVAGEFYPCKPDIFAATYESVVVPQAEPKREPRPCTCHQDDNPPVPCAQKYALAECRATRSGPDEAQIEARDALLDFISENGTASEGVQHYLDRYVRAALAAKEQPE